MAKTDFKSVDEYLATLPKDAQEVLERVRAAIRKAVPKADEVISYQIPCYKMAGKMVIYFAGFKDHYSLYPAGDRMVEAIPELAARRVSKGTLRFSYEERVPVGLIAKIVKFRAKEAAG